MANVSTMTHLVHTGYDPNMQEDFEARVSKYLESTADEANHVLNFVDESMYSVADIDLLEQNLFARALCECLGMQEARSMTSMRDFPEELLTQNISWIPREVVEFIKSILGTDWDALAMQSEKFNTWVDTRKPFADYLTGKSDMSELSLPTTIEREVLKQSSIIRRIKAEQFDDILSQLQKRIGGRNIFGVPTANVPRNDRVLNPERRERIIERAEELLGEDRVMYSAMRDGDENKIDYLVSGEKREIATEAYRAEHGFPTQVWEQIYGNATPRLLQLNSKITLQRLQRFMDDYKRQTSQRGVSNHENTSHIVGGEYDDRCVSAWGRMLQLYGVSESNITLDANISLIHPGDI